MENVFSSDGNSQSRTVRVILALSEDLKELRGIFPPGQSEEQDGKIEAFVREKFGTEDLKK